MARSQSYHHIAISALRCGCFCNASLLFLRKKPVAMSAFVIGATSFCPRTIGGALACSKAEYPRLTTSVKRRVHSSFQRTAPKALETLVLTEENIWQALDEVKEKLGSVFGNSAENLDVGITGEVELASLDGPIVVLRLKGRFWHKRADVLARVSAYLGQRIPEICDIEIEDVKQLQDSEEESARLL